MWSLDNAKWADGRHLMVPSGSLISGTGGTVRHARTATGSGYGCNAPSSSSSSSSSSVLRPRTGKNSTGSKCTTRKAPSAVRTVA